MEKERKINFRNNLNFLNFIIIIKLPLKFIRIKSPLYFEKININYGINKKEIKFRKKESTRQIS